MNHNYSIKTWQTELDRRSIVNLSPKEGVLSAANVLGNGFTMYKTWELSVDLKLERNDDVHKWGNVLILTVMVQKWITN